MKFTINFWSTFFVTYTLTITVSFAKKSSVKILKQLLILEHPYQKIVFINDSLKDGVTNEVLKLSGIPGYELKVTNSSVKSQISTAITSSIQSSLIIACTDNLNQANVYIDLVVKHVPVYQRPKLLIIFYNQNYDLTHNIESILKYAWAHKILDLTVIDVNYITNNTTTHFFIPFDSTVYKQELDKYSQIFPNKFKKLNSYPLNVTFSSNDLFKKMKRGDQFTEFVKIDYTVRYMLRASNFDLKPVVGDNIPVFPYQEEDANSWFSKLNSNVHGVMVSLRSVSMFSNISDYALVHSEEYCRGFVALIPKQHVIIFPVNILIFFVVIPGSIFIFLYVFDKLNKEDNNLQLIQLILGQTVNFDFRKLSSKVTFLTILAVYIIVSNDVYSIIMSINYVKDKFVIDNIEDLAKTDLPIYTSVPMRFIYFNNTDETLMSLDKKVKWIPNCISLANSRNIICIVDYVDGKVAEEKYRNSDGSPMMYIATAHNCDYGFYVFEPASPYIKRFTSIMRRVHASGMLPHAISVYFGFKSLIEKFEIMDIQDEDISQKLWIFTTVGCIIASLAMIIELLFQKKEIFD